DREASARAGAFEQARALPLPEERLDATQRLRRKLGAVEPADLESGDEALVHAFARVRLADRTQRLASSPHQRAVGLHVGLERIGMVGERSARARAIGEAVGALLDQQVVEVPLARRARPVAVADLAPVRLLQQARG